MELRPLVGDAIVAAGRLAERPSIAWIGEPRTGAQRHAEPRRMGSVEGGADPVPTQVQQPEHPYHERIGADPAPRRWIDSTCPGIAIVRRNTAVPGSPVHP